MLKTAAVVVMLALLPTMAAADAWKDESGHGRYRYGEYKEEWRDGNCKYERKWERSGEYKEETKCDGPRWGADYHSYPVVVRVPTGPSITVTIPLK